LKTGISKRYFKMIRNIVAALIMLVAPCSAQTTAPGQPIVPLGF
jgi:hypothetical protein